MKLVIDHKYHDDIAWDLSGHFNHGVWQNAVSTLDGALIQGINSRIWVRPNQTLACLIQMRVGITFRVEQLPTTVPAALVDADWLPSLFLTSDGRLTVRAIGPTGVSCDSSVGAVTPKQWCSVEYTHNGKNTCVLSVDGSSTFSTEAARPIDQLGPLGLSIGNNRIENAIAETSITIREFQLLKFDTLDAARCLADFSHVDKQQLNNVVTALRDAGLTQTMLSQMAYAVMQLGNRGIAATTAGDATKTNHVNVLSTQLAGALRTGDSAVVASTLAQFRTHVAANLTGTDQAIYGQALSDVLSVLPPSLTEPSNAAALLETLGIRGLS